MTRLRLCPTVEGNSAPLITHMIGVDTCLARQRAFYHKCHRCQYRGQSATFEAPLPKLDGAEAAVEVGANGAVSHATKGAAIPADRAGAKPKARKVAAKEAS